MRFLGIDYGTRRIGLAIGDELGVATPIPALVEADLAARRLALAAVMKQRRIDEIVIGYPLNMDGTAGYKAKETDVVAAALRAEFGLPVHLVDERLTSHIAEQGMNQNLSSEQIFVLYQQVLQTSLKLAEAELAKNKADLAKALKDPAVRQLWSQLVDKPVAPIAPVTVPKKK